MNFATLMRDLPKNDAAQAAYASWGWRKIGLMHPFPDAPIYDTLLLPLTQSE